ncbi:MAG: hypothetical protein IPM98_07845 [Lewinellaceae bacterium]|nr:hypothetical protein [Lewinellaceae bacterium]
MAQVGWVYLDDFGGRHRIGLYHGDRTGHLLLHCNSRIIQVDFSVKESRTYSFFVEDELCEVSVMHEGKGVFFYDFQVNKKVDTPRNRLRKADERRTRTYMAILIVGLLAVISGLVLGLRWWGQRQKEDHLAGTSLTSRLTPENEKRLGADGRTAVAQFVVTYEPDQRQVFYGFITADSNRISGRFSVRDTGLIILPNGFPLRDGDAFSVRYLPAEPNIHRVDFYEPADRTIAGYLEQARLAQLAAHPEAPPGYSLCIARIALREKGWQRLADLIFQTAPSANNPSNNRESYLRLVREPGFAETVERECWDAGN